MKRILLIILLAISSTSFAQYGTAYNNPLNLSWNFIVSNSGLPSSQAPRIWTAFDSCRDFHWYTRTMFLDSFRTRNDSLPTAIDKIMYLRQSDGQIMAANAENWYTVSQVDSVVFNSGFITASEARQSLSAGTGIIYDDETGEITNSAPDQTVTINSGTGISVSGSYPSFTISNTSATPTITNSVSRSLNSNFTVSSSKNAYVTYTVACSATNPLLAGSSTANVYLEYSTNGGSSWVSVSQQSITSSVALAVSVALTQSQTNVVSGYIPANALVRLRSTTSGTASVTYITGQEVTF
jgi:hypothetical protein